MAAGSIVVDLLLKTGSFETDSKRAAKRMRDFEKEAVAAAKATAGALLGIVGSAAAAFAALDAAAGSVAKFQDVSEVIGDTAESVASLRTASDVSGTSIDNISAASVKLTAALSKTDDEAKGVGAALTALNIPIEEFKRLSPVQQLESIAAALGKFKDGSEKTAVAVALFGKAGAEQLRFLKELDAQGGRNVVLTEQQIQAADRFADSTARLKSDISQLGQAILVDLLPPFQAVIDEANKADKSLSLFSVAGEGVKTFFETVTVLGANVVFVFKAVGTEIGAIAAQLAALARGALDGFRAISKAVKEDAARARAELDKFEQRVLNAGTFDVARRLGQDPRELARRGRGPATLPSLDISGLSTDAPEKRAKAAKDETERYLESLQKQLERTRDLTAVEQVLADIEARRITGINAAVAGKAIGIAQEIDARKRLEDQLKAEAEQLRELQAARQQQLGEVAKLFDQTRTPLERYNIELERLAKLYRDVGIDQETYFRALAAAKQTLDDATKDQKEQTKEVDDAARDLGMTFASAFEDAIVEGKKLSDVLKGLEKDILRIITRKLVTEPFSNFLTGALGGGGGGLLSGIGSLLGLATGGPAYAGSAYLVGERGPELFVPRASGDVVPSNQTAKMLAGSSARQVTIHQHFAPGADRRTVDQAAADTGMAVRRALARNT